MKIIKKPLYFQRTCENCATVFIYTIDELEEFPYVDYIKCPNCNKELAHSIKNAVYEGKTTKE